MDIKNQIVYEDNHIIVLIKPQNVLSQGDETGDENLVDLLKAYVKEKYNKPGNVYIGLVHRLDRPTGGLMVFARTSKAASRLAEQIQDGEFEKKYATVLVGNLKEKQGRLLNYLEKDTINNVVKVLGFAKDGAKRAELTYKVLEEKKNLSLVEVGLLTGRSHQIRVQFSHIKHPVFGDVKYGGDIAKGWNMALWAYRLKFIHPTTKQIMVFVSEPPQDELPWKNFDFKFDTK